ncbi:MAG: hypothetical protein LCH62_17230 [Proteobacteria bacterium]|nr:hypothetical protein [Pseudomonadota bacterium]
MVSPANPAFANPAEMLIAIAARLVACLERETALLVDMKMQEIAEISGEKAELTRNFVMCVRQAKDRAADYKALGPAVLAEVREAMDKVDETARRNERAIHSARKVNEQVMKTIAEAMNEKRVNAAGYTKAGTRPQPLGKKAAYTYQPMVLDEKC